MVQDKLTAMYVYEIMQKSIARVSEWDSIRTAIFAMLGARRDEILIVENINGINKLSNIRGILTKKDIADLMRAQVDLSLPVGEYMNENLQTCPPTMTAREARNVMIASGIGRLLVIADHNVLEGIITASDLLNTFYLRVEELEFQLDTILENLHEAVCVVDENGIVTFWNRSSEKLYGILKGNIIGHHIKDAFPNALIIETLEKKIPFENRMHSPKTDTEIVISAIPLTIDGRFAGVVSTDRDISEITKLSRELEKEKSYVAFLQDQMKSIIEDKFSFGAIIGKSRELGNAVSLAKQVSKSNASVLITGESGTGKEVFARGIHHESGRKGSFVPINCSAIPNNLLESELFGYVEGAFTGALKKGKAGKFELANSGTIFLDEIGDMPIEMQAKLLRVLQDSKITRVGSEKESVVDVRVIAATHKDLKQLLQQGKFRDDLYYRLNVVSIHLPPLRERKEDINELVRAFIEEFSIKNGLVNMEISSETMKMLTDYPWYGNIRELRNAIERVVILSPEGNIDKDKLSVEILNYFREHSNSQLIELEQEESLDLNKAVERLERDAIKKAMEKANSNKVKAAEILNIKRTTLYYKLKQYDIE